MTVIDFKENADHKITGFVSSGHAGYKKHGPDIVCAGISVLTTNTVNSLEMIAHADMDITRDPKGPVFSMTLRSQPDSITEALLRSMLLGIRGISEEYGSKYCKVTIKEEVKC